MDEKRPKAPITMLALTIAGSIFTAGIGLVGVWVSMTDKMERIEVRLREEDAKLVKTIIGRLDVQAIASDARIARVEQRVEIFAAEINARIVRSEARVGGQMENHRTRTTAEMEGHRQRTDQRILEVINWIDRRVYDPAEPLPRADRDHQNQY